ncbi:hypothetical protein BKA66DRAFT_448585 [Pyrenochaeta sp. MPI-SDFR-AT-0127]|nr:hypothetical protein BKA66DRAFT_448585 [Pyrenochaeta sp. MPI-SDFR-AT-0127]
MTEKVAQGVARQLIERIAREHTLNGTIFGPRFESLVNNCREILSNQLYHKSTHFLLELIQNADDNTLRIDCNEVGFTAANVEAICAISESTKSGKTSDGEYIGEKGFGFKSVFKAADVVWIASREYTFKFDKTQPLGVISPIWAEFPKGTRTGCTSIYLQLSKTYEEETLIQELLGFDTNLLIFLRRIKEINIRVCRPDKQLWATQIRKTESQQGFNRIVLLQAEAETLEYVIRTHDITDLPAEQKRPNWPQTKVLLAYPFLVQADFLLTASREDVESTLPWNRTIRNALAEAFLQSMHHFNHGQPKYIWPYYLPSRSTAQSSFFEPAIASILTQLRESPVLESCAGTMAKASSLTHVPSDLCSEDGVPFALCSLTESRYLSLKYPAWVIEATTSIGVSKLSPRQFLEELTSLIAHYSDSFRARPTQWHSQLANTLVKLSTDAELMSLIQDICVIPLQDSSWTSARGHSIFFAKGETSLEIPSGIRVLIVDSDAEHDPNRRTIFTSLGVKAWEASEICHLILKVHESPTFDPTSLTVSQLVSHALFLHQASWQPPKTADLWFATIMEPDSSAARIFAQLQKRFAVIHNDYLDASAHEAEWPNWLVSNLGLSRVPRLITPNQRGSRSERLPDLPKDWLHGLSPPVPPSGSGSHIPSPLDEELIPTALVIKNISFAVKKEHLVQLMTVEGLALPYAFNYHFDNGVFRGLAFANFTTAEEAAMVMEALDHYEIHGRKLRVDYKKILPLAERKRIEKEERERRGQLSEQLNPLLQPQYLPPTLISSDVSQMAPRPPNPLPAQQQQPQSDIDLNDPQVIQFYCQLLDFKNDLTRDELVFPHTLSPDQRRITHNLVHQMGLEHRSIGENDDRAVHVFHANKGEVINSQLPQMFQRYRGESHRRALNRTAHIDFANVYSDGRPYNNPREPPPVPGVRGSPGGPKERRNAVVPSWTSMRPSDGKTASESADPAAVDGTNGLESPETNEKKESAKVASPATVNSGDASFGLSEEFICMLCECESSDVLQLLRENWHHYSQWIDGSHMKWQGASFILSSKQLKNKLGASLVESAKDPLPLQETVLPALGARLDAARAIPTVDIKDPQRPEWNLLSYFGVLLRTDIHYYLRCLIFLSGVADTDVDIVQYIYEQIQARYSGNE